MMPSVMEVIVLSVADTSVVTEPSRASERGVALKWYAPWCLSRNWYALCIYDLLV